MTTLAVVKASLGINRKVVVLSVTIILIILFFHAFVTFLTKKIINNFSLLHEKMFILASKQKPWI